MKEIAIGIDIPVKVESVVWPIVIYNQTEKAGIYFETQDEQFGRVSFEQLDSLKVSRGEYLPCKDNFNWKDPDCPYCWISKVENSKWLAERHKYESKHYSRDYNWGGDVDEMLTDFSHYIFQFHDQFVEAIAKGFWVEVNAKSLLNKKLSEGHPLLPLLDDEPQETGIGGRVYSVHTNRLPLEQLVAQSQFCSQKLMTITDGRGEHPDYSLTLFKGRFYLLDYFGRRLGMFNEMLTLERLKQLIEESRIKE